VLAVEQAFDDHGTPRVRRGLFALLALSEFTEGKVLPHERTLSGHTGPVKALASGGGWLLSGSLDRSVRVWDAAAGRWLGACISSTSRLVLPIDEVWLPRVYANAAASGAAPSAGAAGGGAGILELVKFIVQAFQR
jgi:WD40 repeat protein